MAQPEMLQRAWVYATTQLTFTFLFLLYLLALCFLGSLALHLLQDGPPRPFVDTLFLSASVTTTTGLLTVDISAVTVGSQVVLFLLMLLGSPVLCSALFPLAKWLQLRAALRELGARAAAQGKPVAALASAHVVSMRELTRDATLFGAQLLAACFAAFFGVGLLIFLTYCSQGAPAALLAERRVGALWFATFHAMSTVNNVGVSLLTDSMAAFRSDSYMLLATALLSIATGVGLPLLMRGVLWLLARARPGDARVRLLQQHPRVVFFNVFPFGITLQMLIWLVLFTAYQWVSTIATDWNSGYWADVGAGERVLLAFFKAVMTRTTGFVASNVADSASADAFLDAIFMYIAAFPLCVLR